MARQSQSHASDVIEEFESLAERSAQWIRDHLIVVLAGLVVVIGGSAAVGILSSVRQGEAEAAADDLARVRRDYLQAMGASPNALDVPELANPAAGEAIRVEYAERFGAIADEHPGTVAAALARLEQGNLADAGGDVDASVALWRETLDGVSDNDSLHAIVHTRIAEAYEDVGRWREAGESYATAAEFESYPLRHWAMGDAVRCFHEAGESERARDLANRLHTEAPDLGLPAHVRATVRELRTGSQSESRSQSEPQSQPQPESQPQPQQPEPAPQP